MAASIKMDNPYTFYKPQQSSTPNRVKGYEHNPKTEWKTIDRRLIDTDAYSTNGYISYEPATSSNGYYDNGYYGNR